ncbi:folylpolyglutamate synthase/dihydrofolate synthase family protein [Dyadobacter sp. Leaf189]|uniref:bifunctional folylpolyglutamate synthase/dihydrofolate synthase n=1 Tax=Dyadobacter sp. Leaf189 TaxID=1736295 RepID=UPI0006FE850C|nr:folylpolyglutamate synthase/dihydrofolate synthase family protein [Dyadobacter sp. Leaf189]KQS28239.1 dihydrofolate synthase [Dyadobacter sp. Leaf189]
MDYQETLDFLYSKLPVFQNIGARAFKPGLRTTQELCKSLGDPQTKYPTIHVGGTNGKGSTSHMLAAVLQQAGYKVGLYTSPHLKDFRERIRINGACVSEQFVVDFTSDIKSNIDRLSPSFFEVTVAMAFSYFAQQHVDVAVIEVGMGGRLDSTNIITPVVSVITNVSLDHTQFLGNTLVEIAGEKAGIIKNNVPVVISEYQEEGVSNVFLKQAEALQAPVCFGEKEFVVKGAGLVDGKLAVSVKHRGEDQSDSLRLDLTGSYQVKNLAGVLTTLKVLNENGFSVSQEAIASALSSVVNLTGLKGRWQQLGTEPAVFCDTAHNIGGLENTIRQFESLPHAQMRFVVGFVKDKDISAMLSLFPKTATYYFCAPSNLRALNAAELRETAAGFGLVGAYYSDVNQALKAAQDASSKEDIIYVGGSTFVVADLDQL